MLISSKDVTDIIMSTVSNNVKVVHVSRWVKRGNKEDKEFVITDYGKLFKGEVERKVIKNEDGKSELRYSHEDVANLRLKEVKAECVKQDGKRVVIYE